MEKLKEIAYFLTNEDKFGVEFVGDNQDALFVTVDGYEEFPVVLSVTDEEEGVSQVICVANLWSEADVADVNKEKMLEMMLKLNPVIPLSSFAIDANGNYQLFGALAVESKMDTIAHEVDVLVLNVVDVLESRDKLFNV